MKSANVIEPGRRARTSRVAIGRIREYVVRSPSRKALAKSEAHALVRSHQGKPCRLSVVFWLRRACPTTSILGNPTFSSSARMRSVIATLLWASFSLQLALATGTPCGMSKGESALRQGESETIASAAMAGMEMVVSLSRVALVGSNNNLASSDAPSQPCEEPASAPSTHCVAPCSATFTIAPSVQSTETAHGPTRALPTTALEPSSRSESPEPPPPRA